MFGAGTDVGACCAPVVAAVVAAVVVAVADVVCGAPVVVAFVPPGFANDWGC